MKYILGSLVTILLALFVYACFAENPCKDKHGHWLEAEGRVYCVDNNFVEIKL